jgi:hypothetical protein
MGKGRGGLEATPFLKISKWDPLKLLPAQPAKIFRALFANFCGKLQYSGKNTKFWAKIDQLKDFFKYF